MTTGAKKASARAPANLGEKFGLVITCAENPHPLDAPLHAEFMRVCRDEENAALLRDDLAAGCAVWVGKRKQKQ